MAMQHQRCLGSHRSSRPPAACSRHAVVAGWRGYLPKRLQLMRRQASEAEAPTARCVELAKGCRTVLAELAGLDFSRREVGLYLAAATQPPPAQRAIPVQRAAAALQQLLADSGSGQVPSDEEGLVLLNAMLSDLWRWRRRGGSADVEGPPHVEALQELQGITPSGAAVEAPSGDDISSSLLDNLNISGQEKAEIGNAMQTIFVASIQSAVWGSIGAALLAILLLNFLRQS